MIRVPGWILGIAFGVMLGACSSGDPTDEPPERMDPFATQPSQAASTPETEAVEPTEPDASGEAEVEEVAEPTREAVSPERLYTVQVASFLEADSARRWADRLSRAGYPTWITQATVGGRTFHRLRIGASPSLAEARGLGDRIRQQLKWPIWIAPVEDNAAVPADAVTRTNRMMR